MNIGGLISRWTDLQVIRETWKRELLKGERKNDNEYLKELGEKWELKLFGENQIPIIGNYAPEPTLKWTPSQGHSQKGVGGNVYMKGITVYVLLKECVKKINWDVDWKKMKVDWTKSIR